MSEEKTPKKYSLKFKSEPVPIEDESGQEQVYTLREFDGATRNDFLAAQEKRKGNGKGPLNVKGMGADLLALTLYGPDGNLVPINVIEKWPSDMQQDLFLRAVELCGLDKTAPERAKND